MKTKICYKCKKEKNISEFNKDKRAKDGHCDLCKQCESGYSKEYNRRHPFRNWARTTRADHKRKYIVEISLDELTKLAKQTKYCPLCGIELNWEVGTKNGYQQPNSPALDRVNNQTKLTMRDVQIICSKCNITKGNRTMKEFINYCYMITNKFPIPMRLGKNED